MLLYTFALLHKTLTGYFKAIFKSKPLRSEIIPATFRCISSSIKRQITNVWFGPIDIFVKRGNHKGERLHVITLFFLPSHSLNIGILTIYFLRGK